MSCLPNVMCPLSTTSQTLTNTKSGKLLGDSYSAVTESWSTTLRSWLFGSRPYVVDQADTRNPDGSGPGLTAALPATPGLGMWTFCDNFRLQVQPLFLGKISNLFSSDPEMEVRSANLNIR